MKPPQPLIYRNPSLSLPRAREQAQASSVLHEGWILKKRRKKMQGFARRHFTLYDDGTLKYSYAPGKPTRDQLSLDQAAISTSSGCKDIHIDSTVATFHLRCLTTGDFETWMGLFRKFIHVSTGTRRSASVRYSTQQEFQPGGKFGEIIGEMGLVITELEKSIIAIAQDNALMYSKKPDKIKDHARKDAVLGRFRKAAHTFPPEEPSKHLGTGDWTSTSPLPPSIQHSLSILNTLKDHHLTLTISLQHFVNVESARGLRNSSLPITTEEDAAFLPGHSKHNSFTTTIGDSLIEWYDARDGPEEFFMGVDEQEPAELVASSDDRSTEHLDGGSCEDTDIEDNVIEVQGQETAHQQDPTQIVQRSELPATTTSDEGSLFAILKNNVGKELSTITFPVTFNEPLTLLQRAAEELEYHELLNKATESDDPITRLCYVAAFAVSGYAHTRHRSGRKGFNPMLGETFEDSRMKFIAEKVRHQPLEIAYHAEGIGWELTATSCGKTKFWGKSLEIIPTGTTNLRVGKSHYTWGKPSSFVRNLIVGTKYLEHCGKMVVEDIPNDIRAVLEFKQNGYWGSTNVVSGAVYANDGQTACKLDGKWDEQISKSLDSSQYHVLWRMDPFPRNTHQFYGFTSFAMSLNEITGDLVGKLPPTDSRYRPDVRALEESDIERAEEEKQRVEELQRQRRRRGEDRNPRWFKQVGDAWVYTGEYWEVRANGWDREHISPLW